MMIAWILAYNLVYIGASSLARSWGNPWPAAWAMAGYTMLLLLWLTLTGRGRKLYLTRPKGLRPPEGWMLLPLLSAPVWNLWAGGGRLPALSAALTAASGAVAEEIFFRGFLLVHLLPLGRRKGILLSALVFAGYHGMNGFSGGDFRYTVLQVFFAFLAGTCFGQMTLAYRSLLPGMLLHILINITGAALPEVYDPSFLLCLICYLFVSLWLERERK